MEGALGYFVYDPEVTVDDGEEEEEEETEEEVTTSSGGSYLSSFTLLIFICSILYR